MVSNPFAPDEVFRRSKAVTSTICHQIESARRATCPNTLAAYFDGTPAGHFFGASDGAAPLNYLQIYAEDIRYAKAHPPIQAKLMEASKRLLGLAE